MIRALDHVNLRTAELERLLRFYVDVIGLREGPRPPFSFPGAWLYAGDRPIVHLVGVEVPPTPEGALRLEHFALAAEGLDAFIAGLRAHRVAFRQSEQTGGGATVIALEDPDGNRLHVDFRS